ncbi:hypothetical protein [Blastochloris tepida]|uniref:Uncharacterized protein n=1 Tax=Blastochloris tepida TaxID=2233851 RepID=A0A348G0N8_9HYPH|nr:hypothetical protein [Blastochloris tepida]BBF93121.1 hypothetical protein BLTE_18060 [Blastochloris tepida]
MSLSRAGLAAAMLALAQPAAAQLQYAPGATPGFSAVPKAVPAAPPAPAPREGRIVEPKSPHTAIPAIPRGKVALALAARYSAEGAVIQAALHWRVFAAAPDANGNHVLVGESHDAMPIFALDPGSYVVHAGYGLAGYAKPVTLASEPVRETFALQAGGLKLQAALADHLLPAAKVSFDIYANSLVGGGPERLLMRQIEPGALVLLPEGIYQVVSAYGDANAVVRADVKVQAGRISDATLRHRAAAITLKLVAAPGGDAIANTAWSVLTPGGDVIKESIGAFPSMVLQEGDYLVIARNEGRSFSREINIEPGKDGEIEVLASDAAPGTGRRAQ